MSEQTLKNIFIFGTVLFLLVLVGMTINSLYQVSTTRTPQLTDAVVAGKQLWQQKNCNDCHTILGIGGYFAPELTQVIKRRGAAWVQSFIVDPQATKPGTTMPNQALVDTQAISVVAFFQWVGSVETNGWPPQPKLALGGGQTSGQTGTQTGTSAGEALFQTKGCIACHMINGQGATGPGPDLSKIGSQPYDALPNDPQGLTKWLQDPPAMKPGTIMPNLGLSQGEIDALVTYLTSLQ